MVAAPAIPDGLGKCAPMMSASARFTVPAASPFTRAICSGSVALSLRVRLLSIPQAMQAPTMASEPTPSPLGPPCHESRTAPVSIAAAPAIRRLSTFSRKITQAIAIVARPSTLSKSDAEDAGVFARPSIKRSGPRTPPETTTRASQGSSCIRSDASADGGPMLRRRRCRRVRPAPEPR